VRAVTHYGTSASALVILQALITAQDSHDMKFIDEQEAIKLKIFELRTDHRDLDDAIRHLTEVPYIDQLQLGRLKKKKLRLKDTILKLESKLIPDLNA